MDASVLWQWSSNMSPDSTRSLPDWESPRTGHDMLALLPIPGHPVRYPLLREQEERESYVLLSSGDDDHELASAVSAAFSSQGRIETAEIRRRIDSLMPADILRWLTLYHAYHAHDKAKGSWLATAMVHPTQRASRVVQDYIVKELNSVSEYAIQENWDNDGALAVSEETLKKARELAILFPIKIEELEKPVVSATPHGEIDFDWAVAHDVMLTISIEPTGNIVFAGMFGDVQASGRYEWTGSLPHFVECCFGQLAE